MHGEDDEPLVYESTGDTAAIRREATNRNDNSSNNTLNTFLQLGDVIEYRDPSHKLLVKKGTIASIGALTSSQNIVGLDNGDYLHKGVHQVRRMSVKQMDHDGHLPNPNPVWKCLTKVIIITPYEDVFSDDEEEGEEDYRWDDNESVDVPPSFSTEQQSPPSQPDHDFNSEARANSWTPNNKRKRTSCGQTKNSSRVQRKRARKDNATLDSRRLTEKFLSWASPGKEYNKAKGKVNELYLMSLQFGVIDKFYERKIQLQRTKHKFEKAETEFRRFLLNRKRSGAISLQIRGSLDIQFMDNPKHGVIGRSRETYRCRLIKEEVITYEYKMRTLQVSTCCVCRENKLIFPQGVIAKDLPKGDAICSICKKNKYHENNKYLKENLQPIWYERDNDGNFKYDDNGEKVIRYDIPNELKSLTMAEKLLIRRCSPLIPSHHIRNGVYGIYGHCVTFPQDIDSMCTELPQKESNMVIFVRNLSDRTSGVIHTQHFKVNKEKVLNALRWLKVHHVGYKDIIINESNMDWIKNGSVYDVAKSYMMQTKKSRRDNVHEASETVSGNQCDGDNDGNELSFSTVHPNTRTRVPTEEQGDIIRSLEKAAKESNQKFDTLDFPPVDNTKPLK
eukprot:scaffold4743_cov225-Skeletonema_menzelii.AAC.2